MTRTPPRHNYGAKAAERIAAELKGKTPERDRQAQHNRNYRARQKRARPPTHIEDEA